MRVLVVSSFPPRRCGIGAYARDQVSRLRGEGHHVTVLAPPDGAGDVRARFLGGQAFRKAARLGSRFDRVVVHFQPALYYPPRSPVAKVATSAALLWLALRRRNLEILVHEADPPIRWRPDYALLRLAFARAGRMLFHTKAEWSALETSYRVRVHGALVAHRVAPAGPVPARGEARHALGLPPDALVFVCPGFLQPSKGMDRVLPAFANEEDGHLHIVGSVRDQSAENVAYAAALRARVEALPRVHLVERFVDDLEFDRWVAAADWVVLPYRRSWSSGVLARAHALGTPAILPAIGGLAEQAGPGDEVVEDDDQAIVRAVREAARSARRRRELPA
jgi:glycosyltransferase involved in cell wall biosynthesis